MIYELRTYVAAPGKIDALNKRFVDHTLAIFERVGIEAVAFFIDRDKPDHLVYLTRFQDEEHRQKAWATFGDDPEWLEVKKESEVDGPFIVDREHVILEPTDYSPLR